MYGHALLSIRHVSSATGPQTTAPVTRATAVAAWVSSLPDSSRFHTACTTAAASASRRAEVGRRALYDGAAHSAFAHAGRSGAGRVTLFPQGGTNVTHAGRDAPGCRCSRWPRSQRE